MYQDHYRNPAVDKPNLHFPLTCQTFSSRPLGVSFTTSVFSVICSRSSCTGEHKTSSPKHNFSSTRFRFKSTRKNTGEKPHEIPREVRHNVWKKTWSFFLLYRKLIKFAQRNKIVQPWNTKRTFMNRKKKQIVASEFANLEHFWMSIQTV